MAFPSYTYTFTNGSTADATQVNQNFTDILNGISDTTKDISVASVTAAGTATLNGNVTLGSSTSKTITFNGVMSSTLNIGTNNSYDIGTITTGGLRALYFSSGAASFTTKVLGQSTAANVIVTLPAATGTLALANTSNVKFIATSPGGQTISDTVINTWTASVDTTSSLSASTTWTCPTTGYYQINACGSVDVPATQPAVGFWAKIFVNGSEIARGGTWSAALTYASTLSIGSSVSRMLALTSGDTVTIKIEQNSGAGRAATGSGAYNWWTIHGLV